MELNHRCGSVISVYVAAFSWGLAIHFILQVIGKYFFSSGWPLLAGEKNESLEPWYCYFNCYRILLIRNELTRRLPNMRSPDTIVRCVCMPSDFSSAGRGFLSFYLSRYEGCATVWWCKFPTFGVRILRWLLILYQDAAINFEFWSLRDSAKWIIGVRPHVIKHL